MKIGSLSFINFILNHIITMATRVEQNTQRLKTQLALLLSHYLKINSYQRVKIQRGVCRLTKTIVKISF